MFLTSFKIQEVSWKRKEPRYAVLLAEDEKALSRVIVKYLEKNLFSVDAVYDGEEPCSDSTADCKIGNRR